MCDLKPVKLVKDTTRYRIFHAISEYGMMSADEIIDTLHDRYGQLVTRRTVQQRCGEMRKAGLLKSPFRGMYCRKQRIRLADE